MRHLIKYGVIALIIGLFFSSERMLIIPLIFLILAVSIPLQIFYALKIKKWENELKRRDVRQIEFHDLLEDMKAIWWVSNHPTYWGRCKTIYFAALHSRVLSFEQKRELFDVFDHLKVKGIPYPKGQSNASKEIKAHDHF
ncbi:hypothetical protein [Exiguobacterium alkaliphilum]|uniref:YcxB-like protein domain-containing protein n=1 Tax=Exiguobacterium alkaliphilum TaxID=1428684 RepID=A0ABT2L3F1_9BACL|nr:hypothetical protein [Exiguobacterium alkaliphilum]MCT4796635.1 hypothetical protein [Exiguobacterium alkaliphilum]